LVLSEKGYGKRSIVDDYRVTNRGGKGVRTISVTEKTGKLVAILNANETNDLMIINKSGIIIRMSVEEIRTMGRATQGVRLIRLGENDEISSIAKVDKFEELPEDEELLDAEDLGIENETEKANSAAEGTETEGDTDVAEVEDTEDDFADDDSEDDDTNE
jgi:DNA gyrase subunit A